MFSTGTTCRAWFRAMCAAGLAISAAPVWAQAPVDATLYRLFLRDGSTIVSYGEFARVSDRVVVPLPLGGTPAAPDLQLVSLPADAVDWDKTDAYAESARAARYAATRGPEEYALLNEAVSRALGDIALTPDPARKIAMAGEARQNVTRWAAEHYAYRAQDVARLASLFDDVVAETRAASGEKNFELSLVANLAAPPAMPMLPPPTLQETIEQGLRAATLAPDATERMSLLRGIDRVLAGAGAGAAWAAPLRMRAAASLAVETRTEEAYAKLSRDALANADRLARTADVTGVERVMRTLLREDDRLGQRRPQEMASVLAALDAHLDAARRLRLARDAWEAHAVVARRYQQSVAEPLALMRRSRAALDEIRRLAGPSRVTLARLAERLETAERLAAALTAPAEEAEAHASLGNATRLARRAVEARQRAVASGSMQTAWEASSAAAGAVMLLDRALQDLRTAVSSPVPARPHTR